MAGRRWGPGVSGWLVGFPLTSGPVAFFLALDHGLSFAAGAAVGSMTRAAPQAAFCVLYGRLARRRHWTMALLRGRLAFAAAPVLLQGSTFTLVVLRGLLLGLFAFAGFFFVLALSIERAGIAQAFAAAIAAALILQIGALWLMRRESRAGNRPLDLGHPPR